MHLNQQTGSYSLTPWKPLRRSHFGGLAKERLNTERATEASELMGFRLEASGSARRAATELLQLTRRMGSFQINQIVAPIPPSLETSNHEKSVESII